MINLEYHISLCLESQPMFNPTIYERVSIYHLFMKFIDFAFKLCGSVLRWIKFPPPVVNSF